jgi:hypothetical protein
VLVGFFSYINSNSLSSLRYLKKLSVDTECCGCSIEVSLVDFSADLDVLGDASPPLKDPDKDSLLS